MNDLEARIRGALQEDAAWRSADALLDDVRRGARRRRARRTTGVAAAAALVLAATGAGLAWHGRETQAADHSQVPEHLQGAIAVSVSASGTVFKVVADQDCVLPCSVVWKQDGAGGWTRLATFHDNSENAWSFSPLRGLVMAPDGRNGWAWGKALYATHDGGTTWAEVPGVPYVPYTQIDVEVGTTEAWITSQTDEHGTTLWHAAVGSDDWSQVQPPEVTVEPGVRVAPKDWSIHEVLPDGRVVLEIGPFPHRVYETIGDERGWTKQYVRCTPIPPLLGGRVQNHRICGPAGPYDGRSAYFVPLRYSQVQVAVHPGTASAPVGDADILYATRNRAVIATPAGIIPSDLRLGQDDRIVASSESGDHVAILTRGHRIFLSDDGGRHWHELP